MQAIPELRSPAAAVLKFTVGAKRYVYSAREHKIFEEPLGDEPTVAGNVVFTEGQEVINLRFPPPASIIRPRTLEFVITGSCNLACSYCATRDRYKLPSGRNDLLTTSTALAFLDLIRPYLTRRDLIVKFFGGEPLLGIKVIKAIVQRLEEWGIKTDNVIATNGLLLSDATVDFLVKHEFLTLISIDGPPEIHNANRIDHKGRGSYEEVVKKVLRFRERYPSEFASKVAINMVVSPRFSGRFREQVDHLVAMGISPSQINPNDCAATSDLNTRYSIAQWRRVQEEKTEVRSKLIEKARRNGLKSDRDCFETYAGLNLARDASVDNSERNEREQVFECRDCQSYEWNTVTLLPDGVISSCIEFDRLPPVEFGNAKKRMLDLGAFAAFQESFRKSVREGPCARCWAVRVCPMVSCYKTFASAGASPNWQRIEDCEIVREELASRFRDAVKLYLLRKETVS